MDRLLLNRGIDVDALQVHWVPYVVGERDSITVAMDGPSSTPTVRRRSCRRRCPPWTGHAAGLAHRGQATLKYRRNGNEYQVRAPGRNPARRRPCADAADGGFGDYKLDRMLSED